MLKYLSLFSGIGGFELGIKNSRYGDDLICVGYSEIDKYADSIYKRQFPVGMVKGTETHTPFGDITKVETSDLPNFELLVGGFPCQAFSLAGLRRGFDDTRGTLFFEIARVLKDKRPKYFLLENVKGLLSHNKGETFKTMLGVLSDLGYDVEWEIYNSKNHGVPQNRERIYLKGYSRRKCGREILHKRKSCEDLTGEISGEYFGVRTGRIHNTDKLINCLGSIGQNSGGRQLIRVNNTKHQSQMVYDPKGIAPTLCGSSSGDGRATGLYKINEEDSQKSDDQTPKNSDEIIQVNNRKPQSKRVYDPNGITPALCGGVGGDGVSTGLYLETEKPKDSQDNEPKLIKVNDGKFQAQTVYDSKGIACTLCGNGGGDGGKTGLYLVPNDNEDDDSEPKIKKVGNFSPTNHYGMNIYGSKGLCPTLCSGNVVKNGLHILDEDQETDEWFLKKCEDSLCKDSANSSECVGNLNPCGVTIPFEEYTVQCDKVHRDAHHGKDILGQNGVSSTITNTNFKHPISVADDDNVKSEEQMNHKVRVRRLTPVECERLQAFPDNWTQYGVDGELISNTQRYKCIGNAVTTNVIRDIFNNWDLKF